MSFQIANVRWFASLVVLVTVAACGGESAPTTADNGAGTMTAVGYFDGSAVPTPRVFGPGTISVGNVFRGTFAPEGEEFYFFKQIDPRAEDFRIYRSTWNGEIWQEPVRVDFGGEHSDMYPAVFPDGSALVFSSYRPVPGYETDSPNANLWIADRGADAWRAPRRFEAAARLDWYHASVSVTRTGDVFFDAVSPDWSYAEFMVARRQSDGSYDTAVPYGPVEALRSDNLAIAQVYVGPDERTIVFEATQTVDGQAGTPDLFAIVREGDGWSAVRELGDTVNTPAIETFPVFSPDGVRLIFSRDLETFQEVSLSAVGLAR